MKATWVCKNCCTNNTNEISESTDRLVCFVCGHARTDEPLYKPGSLTVIEGLASSAAPAEEKTGLIERIVRFFRSTRETRAASKGPGADPEIVDWTIERGPDDSKEAYLTAEPVYRDTSDEGPDRRVELPPAIPTEERSDGGRARLFEPRHPKPERPTADSEPWPEHRIRFQSDRLLATDCVKWERAELNGVKGYELTFKNGNRRFMTVQNLKLIGYVKDLV